eukprot:Em0002g1747a
MVPYLFLVAALLSCGAHVAIAQQLQVHIVPHTHDDVGWLKTVDEYYYGANNSIQHAGVQYILDTVIDELSRDPNKTFIYVEMAYFWRWWNEQDDVTKALVKTLVNNKQLEFVNAGWCMNDEASTDYNSVIDQMSLGLRFVEDTFGPQARPRVAWHIDPFGHSADQAALFAKMGYDGFFFARIDYADKNLRGSTRNLELVWRGSQSLGAAVDMFTGVLYYGYGPPPGFCFDVGCDDEPIMDDPDLFDNNVKLRVEQFLSAVAYQWIHYQTSEVMLTFGSDFQFEDAHQNFKNIDKLIKYVNQDGRVHAFYSTPSRYIDAVHAANKTWTLKTDDFFPYADYPNSYWTGYFTSRPALKGYTRVCNGILQACKQLEAIHNGFPGQTPSSVDLQMAMGIDQHHDAVSGTSKQHVAYDYAKRLHIGQVECQDLMANALSDLAARNGSFPLDLQFCEYLNVSFCPSSETDTFNVIIYNPVAVDYGQLFGFDRVFAFPVIGNEFNVYDSQGNPMDAQHSYVGLPECIINIDSCAYFQTPQVVTDANYLIYIQPKGDIPPIGFKTYFIRPISNVRHTSATLSKVYHHKNGDADFSIANEVLSLTFDGVTGRLKSMSNIASDVTASVDQQFLWWNASDGNNVNSSQASGAYIFRPNGTAPFPINPGNVATVTVVKGDLVQEVRQVFSPWVSQTIRLYTNTPWPVVVFEYTIGPIPHSDGLGKEVISRFSTDLASNQIFFTDANGREMQTRIRNYRPTWTLNVTEPVAGNYYPVNSRIYIQEPSSSRQFTVLTDRTQGGSSLSDGQVELMVHRCLLYDDSRGVGEPLCEPGDTGQGLVVRGTHVVVLDNAANSALIHRAIGETMLVGPIFAFVPSAYSYSEVAESYNTEYYGLVAEVPLQVHLLTLQWVQNNTLLIRVENKFEIDEFGFGKAVNVSLDMFAAFKVIAATELTLGGNAELSSVERLQWNIQGGSGGKGGKQPTYSPVRGPDFVVTLEPMDIRTFEIQVVPTTN